MSVKLRSFELIEQKIDEKSEKFSGDHDEHHALRVRDTGWYISQREGGDHRIVEPSCLLHDYFRPEEDEYKKILENKDIKIKKSKINKKFTCLKEKDLKNMTQGIGAIR